MSGDRVKNVIWEGRYQPFHRGHLSYIERLLDHADHVWVIVVANETAAELGRSEDTLPVPEFTAAVDPHHVPDKNPLPFWLRYRIVCETLGAELPGAPVTALGGRRLDLAWDLYAKILPPDRAFLTPLRDDFEDAKAAAWNSLGEEVLRIDVDDLPRISGTMVRAAFRRGEEMGDLLCPRTLELLDESGYLDRLGLLS